MEKHIINKQDQSISLPIRQGRHSTDILCLVVLFCCWLAMTLIGLAALGYPIASVQIQKGNPDLLLHGVDYKGNICGISDSVKDELYTWNPNLLGTNADSNGKIVPILFTVCVSGCPQMSDVVNDIYGSYGSWTSPYDTTASNILYYCISSTASDQAQQTMDTPLVIFRNFIESASVIGVAGYCLAVVVSLLFLLVIRIPCVLRMTVWFCIYLVLALFSAGGYSLIMRSRTLAQSCTSGDYECNIEVSLSKAVGGVLVCCAVLWLSFICFMRERIALAIGLIRESAKALSSMVLLCLLPLVQTALFVGFTAIWCLYCVYLVSSGTMNTHVDASTGLSYKTMSFDSHAKDAILFLVFVWFWSIGFIEAMGQILTSHAVLGWYFASEEERSGSSSVRVLRSACCCIRYHMGSAAFGSLSIALLRTLRMSLGFIQRKMSLLNQERMLSRFCCCCLRCLILLFEKCLKFLNKHAYIQVALTGAPFCLSARRAFVLIVRNLGRLAAVTVVGDFVVLVGKLSVTLTCSAAAYLYLTQGPGSGSVDQNGVMLPVLLVAFAAFFSATMFLGVLSATADSMLQACIVEEELNKLITGQSDVYGHCGSGRESEKDLRDLLVVHAERWREGEEGQEPIYGGVSNGEEDTLTYLLAAVQQSSSSGSVGGGGDRNSGTVALVNLTVAHTMNGGGPDIEAVSPIAISTGNARRPVGDEGRVARLTPREFDEEEVRLPGDRTSRYACVQRERPPSNQQRQKEFLWE